MGEISAAREISKNFSSKTLKENRKNIFNGSAGASLHQKFG
ncbi:hypothetical protein [Alteromonas pelagimontana]|nr:hypothetical protein [Alteromonas pelagimontana]